MAGTSWPALTAGQKARASDVEAKFDWIEGSIVPMNGGSTTTGVYDLGTSTAHWNKAYINEIANTVTIDEINNTLTVKGIELSSNNSDWLTINPCEATPIQANPYMYVDDNGLSVKSSTMTTLVIGFPVHIPKRNPVITAVDMNYYSNEADAIIQLTLMRVSGTGTANTMASLWEQTTGGYGVGTTSSITFGTLSSDYTYMVRVRINGGAVSKDDGALNRIGIKYEYSKL